MGCDKRYKEGGDEPRPTLSVEVRCVEVERWGMARGTSGSSSRVAVV